MIQTEDEVRRQSENAMLQWEAKWRSNCTMNAEIYRSKKERLNDLLFRGRGRTCVAVANGASLENDVEILAKWQAAGKDFDIICVDKSLKPLMENGVRPTYVVVADASVSPEYFDGVDLEGIALISNINAQPDWAKAWKGPIYFYVNKDNIQTEQIFSQISGCWEHIPAASNVGNAVCVLAGTVFDYDKVILTGYDFCWSEDDNYYAFQDSDKRYWMGHRVAVDRAGRIVSTSENLVFSARWLMDFLSVLPRKIFWLGNQNTILDRMPDCNMDRQLSAVEPRVLGQDEVNEIADKVQVNKRVKDDDELQYYLKNHKVRGLTVSYIPEGIEWLK